MDLLKLLAIVRFIEFVRAKKGSDEERTKGHEASLLINMVIGASPLPAILSSSLPTPDVVDPRR